MINNASNLLNDYTTPKGLKFKFDKDEKILVDSFLFQLGVGFGSLMCIAFITNKRIIIKQTNRQLSKAMKQQAFLNADMKNIYWKDVKEINLGNGKEFSKIFLLGNDGVVIRDFSPEGDTEDKVRGIVTINPNQSLLQMNGDLTYNGNRVVSVDSKDIVKAFGTATGAILWEQDDLKLRKLTSPASISNLIAVGDFEGYIHLLNAQSGAFEGREKVSRDAITEIESVGNNLLLVDTSGLVHKHSIK